MLSEQVKRDIPKIQEYLKTQPIVRAWLFGFCSRGEETPDSDMDILVDYDKTSRISLLSMCRYMNELEDIIHRRVDLIENGRLMSFAAESANRDKILIYERENQG